MAQSVERLSCNHLAACSNRLLSAYLLPTLRRLSNPAVRFSIRGSTRVRGFLQLRIRKRSDSVPFGNNTGSVLLDPQFAQLMGGGKRGELRRRGFDQSTDGGRFVCYVFAEDGAIP